MTTLAFCKPFQVLCQFSAADNADGDKINSKKTLADFITTPGVYPAGRLDFDSEGLLLLTDNGPLQNRISSPRAKLPKTYWVQVDGAINLNALSALAIGVDLKDGRTKPAKAQLMSEPEIWLRDPPIRQRQNIPTSWLSLTLTEGRNRQVRRMTAAVGYPTLRLIRTQIGDIKLDSLQPGQWRTVDEATELPSPSAKPAGAARNSPPPHPHRHTPNRRGKSSNRRS